MDASDFHNSGGVVRTTASRVNGAHLDVTMKQSANLSCAYNESANVYNMSQLWPSP